jgi:signal transduction histidine kinase
MKSNKQDSIATSLTRMNMLVSGTALLFACLAFLVYDLLTARERLLSNLSTQAEIIGTNSASALIFDDPEAAGRTLSALRSSPNILSAGLWTATGQPFASYQQNDDESPPVPSIPPGQIEVHEFDGMQVSLARAIVFQENRVGTVSIRVDLQEVKNRLHQYATIAAAVLLLSLVAALVVSSIFRRAVADPITKLAEVARVVSRDKDYSVRVTSETSRGEVAVLMDAFNNMLSQIQEQDGALRKAHDDLEQRVQERTAELTAANKELEAFSYSVSHDLRAPLRSIDGFSQALLEDYSEKLDADGTGYLRRVRSAAQRMSLLIDDMLNLARVTRSALHREPLDLSTLARSVAQELQAREPERKVEVIIEDGALVEGDARLLRVAIENLLGNAWKYTSRHGHARIEFGRNRDNGRVVYFVRDDGAGFDPNYAARLFGAFQRLHGADEFPGTGIGLATVQRIIHKHGGSIWAEGAVEKGATFYFTL